MIRKIRTQLTGEYGKGLFPCIASLLFDNFKMIQTEMLTNDMLCTFESARLTVLVVFRLGFEYINNGNLHKYINTQ